MRAPRLLLALAGVYAVAAGVYAAFGIWLSAALTAGAACVAAAAGGVVHLIKNHHGRKSNGRHRKASEAHRAGAGRGADDGAGTRARGGAVGAGASMSGPYLSGGRRQRSQQILDQALQNILTPQGAMLHAQIAAAASGSTQSMTPKPRPAGEFDGKQAEFAPGVVTGTRSFDVDQLGRLLGVAYRAVWVPGENEATCLERRTKFSSYGLDIEDTVRAADRPSHSIADCSHGFYGYYEGSNDYYEHGRVMGVVEAYGETIIGSRGFRASKARIVALHIPSDIPAGRRRLIARNYPKLPIFDSFDAMVAEFPADDAGHGLNPTTDPDFWTRKA